MTCSTTAMQFTFDAPDDRYNSEGPQFEFRLSVSFLPGSFETFTGDFCYWPDYPASVWDPVNQPLEFVLQSISTEKAFYFSDYTCEGTAQCVRSYHLSGSLESWMTFNDNPVGNTGAELILDFSGNPAVNPSYTFTFEVKRGTEIIESESFTIRIIDCTTDDFSGSAFIPVVDWPPTS